MQIEINENVLKQVVKSAILEMIQEKKQSSARHHL